MSHGAVARPEDAMTDPFAAMFEDIQQDYGAALSEVDTDADGVRRWRDVVFADVRGFRPLMLYVSVPRSASPPPLVVFIHGGGWQLGHPMVTNPVYRRIDPIGKLLRAGFAVARISYRLSAEGAFPIQLHDCKAAVRFLRNRASLFGVDPERFAAMGDSAGGHLAALVGLTAGAARRHAGHGRRRLTRVPARRRPAPKAPRGGDGGLADHLCLAIGASVSYSARLARPPRAARTEPGAAPSPARRRRRLDARRHRRRRSLLLGRGGRRDRRTRHRVLAGDVRELG
jgi:hypothetical protein